MATPECPLPDGEAALGPFIKPRDEVAAIRRNLQAYLRKQLPLEGGTPLSALNLTTPPDGDLKQPPPALSGVRKAYWNAVRASQAAQAKYDALKSELDALKRPDPIPPATTGSMNEAYLSLLRQREKLRRLKVLDRAHSSLPILPADSLDNQIKAHLGSQPTPPSIQPPTSGNRSSPVVEAKLLALKKAVLTIQRRVQDQEARNAVVKASLPALEQLDDAAKIAGLQNALQKLTIWMEEMLGVIADAEAEAVSANSTPATPSANGTPRRKVDVAEIEAAYERYLHSRRRLIARISSHDEDDDAEDMEPLFPNSIASNHKALNNKATSSEILLPHVPRFTGLKARESSLLQQKAYIRRQLSTSEAETTQLIRRLAGESLLVQPGASRGVDWLQASREAFGETDKVVMERVKAGKDWSEKARETVDGIEGLPGAVENCTERQ